MLKSALWVARQTLAAGRSALPECPLAGMPRHGVGGTEEIHPCFREASAGSQVDDTMAA